MKYIYWCEYCGSVEEQGKKKIPYCLCSPIGRKMELVEVVE